MFWIGSGKARGGREASLVAVAEHLIHQCGVDPCASPAADAGCTALIIASCRGLPKLVALLLASGADPTVKGEGRFRLCGSSKTLFGCHTASAWVDALLAAEAANGGTAESDRLALVRCKRLLAKSEAQWAAKKQ